MTSTSTAATLGPTRVARPLRSFALVALPSGWLFLSIPLLTGLPIEPFVLATLFLGMVPMALLITRRSPDTTVRQLLRDCVRPPRPLLWLVPALLLIPVATRVGAVITDGATDLTSAVAVGLLVNVASSVLIVNLWEEMVWAGVVQRSAASRYGFVRGALLTAVLFSGIHLPLAFYGVDDAGDVAYNVAIMVASAVGLRLMIGALDRWSGRSILTVAILHASFNASSELVDADDAWVRYAVTLVLGLLVLAVPSLRRDRTVAVVR